MESERSATAAASTLYPPPSPQEVAEADRVRCDTDSNTIAGLQRLVLLACTKNEDLSRRYVEDGRNYHRDVQNLAATVLELNTTAAQMQRDYRASMEVARKPIQPRPTVAETVGHSVDHIVTELRKSLQVAFGENPELQEKAQKGLETVIEKGKALITAMVPEPPPTPATSAPDSTPAPEATATPPAPAPPSREQIIEWMDAIGQPFLVKIFARHGTSEPEDLKGPVLDDLRTAYALAKGV